LPDITRREFDKLLAQVNQIEGRIKRLEDMIKVHEQRLKPSNLYHSIRQEHESIKLSRKTQNPQL